MKDEQTQIIVSYPQIGKSEVFLPNMFGRRNWPDSLHLKGFYDWLFIHYQDHSRIIFLIGAPCHIWFGFSFGRYSRLSSDKYIHGDCCPEKITSLSSRYEVLSLFRVILLFILLTGKLQLDWQPDFCVGFLLRRTAFYPWQLVWANTIVVLSGRMPSSNFWRVLHSVLLKSFHDICIIKHRFRGLKWDGMFRNVMASPRCKAE